MYERIFVRLGDLGETCQGHGSHPFMSHTSVCRLKEQVQAKPQMSVIYDDAYVSKMGLGRRRSIGCRNQVSGLGFLLQKQARLVTRVLISTNSAAQQRTMVNSSSWDIYAFWFTFYWSFSAHPDSPVVLWWETVIFHFICTLLSCSYFSLTAQRDYGSPEWALFEREIFLNHHGNILMMLNQLQENDDMANLI